MVTLPPFLQPRDGAGEQRVLFHHLRWDSYIQILEAIGKNRFAHLHYETGLLEITMPSTDHEQAGDLIDRFIGCLATEMGLSLTRLGAVTLKQAQLDRGGEPDYAYRFQSSTRSAPLDPDLILEVDITPTAINKCQLYSQLGVPELWRCNGQDCIVYSLEDGSYVEVEVSPTFPTVPKAKLYEFMAQAQSESTEVAEQLLRQWIQAGLAQDVSA